MAGTSRQPVVNRICKVQLLANAKLDAVAYMEEQVKQCASNVQMWRQASTEAHDVFQLLRKTGENIQLLPQMQVTEILVRWVEYHVKQSRRLIVVDGPVW